MSRSLPPADCKICGSSARAITYSTFSYWYCDKCKDECDVWLRTSLAPRGELYAGMPKEPGDITINEYGVYSVTYHDGSHEWYEHKPRSRDIRLSGTYVSSATRLTNRDLPSRKRVQPVPAASEGASNEGLSLRIVSSEANSLGRYATAIAIDPKDIDPPLPDYGWIQRGKVHGVSGSSSGCLPPGTKAQVPDMAQSNQLLQHGSVPPDDTL